MNSIVMYDGLNGSIVMYRDGNICGSGIIGTAMSVVLVLLYRDCHVCGFSIII